MVGDFENPALATILSKNTNVEAKENQEFDSRLPNDIDRLVGSIKKSEGIDKQKMLANLLARIKSDFDREVSNFYREFNVLLLKRGATKNDVYNEAIIIMMKFVDTWQDQEARVATGETPSHFTTFLFHKEKGMHSKLVDAFVRTALAKKRMGYEVSFEGYAPKLTSDEGDVDIGSILPDQDAEDGFLYTLRQENIKIGREAVLNKLYSDNDPLLSFIVILRFGLGKDVLDAWRLKFNRSVRRDELKQGLKKYIPMIRKIIREYNAQQMTLEEIGILLDLSGERIRQKFVVATKILKEQLQDYNRSI
jgi:hypothetical protein